MRNFQRSPTAPPRNAGARREGDGTGREVERTRLGKLHIPEGWKSRGDPVKSRRPKGMMVSAGATPTTPRDSQSHPWAEGLPAIRKLSSCRLRLCRRCTDINLEFKVLKRRYSLGRGSSFSTVKRPFRSRRRQSAGTSNKKGTMLPAIARNSVPTVISVDFHVHFRGEYVSGENNAATPTTGWQFSAILRVRTDCSQASR